MKFKAKELHGKTVEEIEKILTDKLTPEEREKAKQINEMFEREAVKYVSTQVCIVTDSFSNYLLFSLGRKTH